MFHEDWYSSQQCLDLERLLEGVKNLAGSIIEIGCWEGKSTVSLANKCYPERLV